MNKKQKWNEFPTFFCYLCKTMQATVIRRLTLVMGWIAALAFLISCGGRQDGFVLPESGAHLALAEIDSLMWQQPDSAFATLMDFASNHDTDSLEEFDRHYFNLLLSELLYKEYCEQSNRQELLQAAYYFDSLKECGLIGSDRLFRFKFIEGIAVPNSAFRINLFLSARAHYIKGVGYYERDSVVEACGEYLKALEIMEEYFKEKDFVGKKAQFLSLTHNRLGELFSGQFMMEPSIVCYEQAYHYCSIDTTSARAASNILYQIGKQYDKMNDYDRARHYYDQALEKLKSSDNCLYRDIVASMALCDYLSGHDTKRPFDDLRQILSLADDDSERLNRFLTIGTLLLEEKMYDSAVFYLKPVFECSEDILSRIQAAECLRRASIMTNDEAKAEYVRFLASHVTESYNNAVTTSKLEKAFQSFTDHEQVKKATQEKKASVLKTLRIVVPTGLALTALLLIAIKRRNREDLERKERLHKEEIDRRQAESDTMLREKDTRLEQEQKARHIDNERLQNELRSREEQLTALWDDLERMNEEVGRLRKERSKMKSHQEEKRQLQKDLREREERLTALRNDIMYLCEEAEPRRKAFLEEPVCQKIIGSLRGVQVTARNSTTLSVSFSDGDASMLGEAVSRHYRSFDTLLSSKSTAMNEEDLLLCHLLLLGLNDRQISVLMFKSYSAVKKHVNRLEKALKIQGGLADFILQITGF